MAVADEVGVLEGIADGVAISSLGFHVVSPVTVSFNEVDLERFLSKCREHGIKRVWVLFDNELSGSGNYAARRTALKLVEGGLTVRIVTLPLGPVQKAAREQVLEALGPDVFDELEQAEPAERKRIVAREIADESKRAWVLSQIETSKIDAAEWVRTQGAGAAGRFAAIVKGGVDVIDLELEDVEIDEDDEPWERADAFGEIIDLVAHVDDTLARGSYAGKIAKAAGKGINKSEIGKRIASARRETVKPKKAEAAKKAKADHSEIKRALVLPPPETTHAQPPKPPAPEVNVKKGGLQPPPLPGKKDEQSDHDRYASAREAVAKSVEAKLPEEVLGQYVAQIVTKSMGFTPFRTPDELFLVRGNQRVPVGLERHSPRFNDLLWLASGLTTKKASHRAYVAAVVYFLGHDARSASEVSWSYVDPGGAVYFPTGDRLGRILKIEPGNVTRTKMSDVRVPAVAGDEFRPFTYTDDAGGIDAALGVFRWTSISEGDRMVLIYWLACLPILRRVGTIPIVRIEGGSSSGKTRTVDAVSMLVNGCKSSSVPTAPALVSRMSTEMLTIDDNRETGDVSSAFLGTLLQATHLGAREKRKHASDTGTVVERVCGGLLMNGIEPIHDGRSELASRILTLSSSRSYRAPDSPSSEATLRAAVLSIRDRFWSESARRCAVALALDVEHGESLGEQFEELFGETKIGRLSAYLRLMYLAWAAGQPAERQPGVLAELAPEWAQAFGAIAAGTLQSLLAEELVVSALRYVFAYGVQVSEAVAAGPFSPGLGERVAFDGKFVCDPVQGDAYLGPMRARQLARIARTAGRELNAPRAIATELRAGQLESRILDGLDFLRADGFEVEVEETGKGRRRYTFRHGGAASEGARHDPRSSWSGDTWTGA